MSTEVPRSLDLSERLVRHAAVHAPPALRERLEEEWLADLHVRRGPASRLRFALGCAWASRVIASEQPGLALAGAGRGRIALGALGAHTPVGLTRRGGSVLVVVGLHAALFYAGWSSLALIHKTEPPGPIQYTPVPPPSKVPFHPDEGVSLNPVRINDPPPLDDLQVARDADLPRVVAGDMDVGSGREGVPPAEPRTPQRVPGAPGAGFPNVDDFYPAISIRAGEAGVTAVRVCVNAQGRLEGDPVTVRSSGFGNLDAASLKLAKAGSGHYRPSTEDGRPVPSCFAYAVRFRLK